jgi:hypothetical protein
MADQDQMEIVIMASIIVAIAIVRRRLWSRCHFSTSNDNSDVVRIPRQLPERLTDAVWRAAKIDKVELSWRHIDWLIWYVFAQCRKYS